MKSGGGTRISSAYELTQQLLENRYPWDEWNRYVFAAGDGENRRSDTDDKVIPLMEEIQCNLHGYLEVGQDNGWGFAEHGEAVEEHFGTSDNVAVSYVENKDDVMDAIEHILSTEDS